MSELNEIRRELIAIRDVTSRTAQDVSWIKEGMERGSERMDTHSRRLTALEHGSVRNTGFAAGVGSVFGAAIGVVAAKLGIPWPAAGSGGP